MCASRTVATQPQLPTERFNSGRDRLPGGDRDRDGRGRAHAFGAFDLSPPPCSSERARTSARPRPVPGLLPSWLPELNKGIAQRASRRSDANASVRNREGAETPTLACRDRDGAARRRELDRVGEKVEQDLLQRPPVGVDSARRGRDVDAQGNARARRAFLQKFAQSCTTSADWNVSR